MIPEYIKSTPNDEEPYPFGKEYQTSPAVKDNSRKFIGKEKDKETDLTYFGARYYDDLSGRFLAPDPVRPVNALTSKTNQEILNNPQRLNRHAYGLNNPYKYVDPDGNSPVVLALASLQALLRTTWQHLTLLMLLQIRKFNGQYIQ